MATGEEQLSIASIVRETLAVFGRNIAPMTAVAVAVASLGPFIEIVTAVFDAPRLEPTLSPAALVLRWFLFTLTGVVGDVVLTSVALDDLSGRRGELRSYFDRLGANFRPALGVWMITGAGFLAVSFLSRPLLFIAAVAWSIGVAVWMCAVPAVLAESLGVRAALARSLELVRRRAGAVLGFAVVFEAFDWLVTLAVRPSILREIEPFNPLSFWLLQPLAFALLTALGSCACAVVYVRLAGRAEHPIARIFD